MNRRNFFRFLPASAAGGAAVVLAKPSIPAKENFPDGQFSHGRWSVYWSGWKPRSDGTCSVGQWIAAPDSARRFNLYSSVPGYFGPFSRGEVFNIAFREDQDLRLYDFDSCPISVREKEKSHALKILLALCDLGEWPAAPWDERMSGERLAHLYLVHKGLVPAPRA